MKILERRFRRFCEREIDGDFLLRIFNVSEIPNIFKKIAKKVKNFRSAAKSVFTKTRNIGIITRFYLRFRRKGGVRDGDWERILGILTMKRITRRHFGGARQALVARLARLIFAGAAAFAAATPNFSSDSLLTSAAFAQSGVSGRQLTVAGNETLSKIDDSVSSVYFNGAFALTLSDSQKLTPIFLNATSGAVLNLGSGATAGQSWTLAGNSIGWTGTTNVRSGNTLTLSSDVANPAGAFSTDGRGAFSTTTLNDGATLKLEAGGKNAETKIGALGTAALGSSPTQNAVVDIAGGKTLTVENGASVDANVGLTKTGAGTLQFLANGTASTGPNPTPKNGGTSTLITPSQAFNFGRLDVQAGTFRLADGTANVDAATINVSAISLANGATLDLQKRGEIQLAGNAGETVFSAGDGSVVNVYVDENGATSFRATTNNTYINLGAATINVIADRSGAGPLQSATIFSAENVGQTTYDAATLKIVDNVLGKEYAVDKIASNAEKLVLQLQDSKRFAAIGKTRNERELGAYLDRKIASGNYSDAEYAFLDKLETNQNSLNLNALTGEIYASTVGFSYLNNFTANQVLFSVLRNNALAGYSGGASVAPQNYETTGVNAVQPGIYGGAANGYFDPNSVYYETGTDPYGNGVAPVYEGAATGGYNGYGAGADFGGFGWNGATPQNSALATVRGQAVYGDPGTLIYSAWFAALGGQTEAKVHEEALAYDGEQYGFLTGLDLFGSCDCRFGLYYGYQDNELKKNAALGTLSAKNHQLGIYHQFGDEQIYNIATIRGGYDRYDTKRVVDVLGTSGTLGAKYDGWNAGASFERGANFALQPFVLSPYLAVDYNFLQRESFEETASAGSGTYALRGKRSNYHSLRGIVGGRVLLDMYPGEQHVRVGIRAAYVHEFLDAMYGETSLGFTALPGAGEFTVIGNSLGRDWGLFGAGLDWAPIPALLLFYEADVLKNKYVRDLYNTVGVKFRW